MKRTIAILLILAISLSLCACSAITEKTYIGTWTGKFVGEKVSITFSKDGSGVWEGYMSGQPYEMKFTWELSGESVVAKDGSSTFTFTVDTSEKPFKLHTELISDPLLKTSN